MQSIRNAWQKSLRHTIADSFQSFYQIKDEFNLFETIINEFNSDIQNLQDQAFKSIQLQLTQDKNFLCQECEQITHISYKQLYETTFYQKALNLIKKICDTVWNKELCPGYIDTFQEALIQSLLDKYLNSKLLCSKMKICSYTYKTDTIQDFANWILNLPKNSNIHENFLQNSNEDTYKFVQLTDTHYDDEYKIGSEAECGLTVCCYFQNGNVKKPAKKWGTISRCDLPKHTIQKTLDWIQQNLEFDFIIWNGDSNGHDEWKQKAENAMNHTITITRMINQTINKPLIPIFGNHEIYPCDQENFNQDKNQIYGEASRLWSNYIGESATNSLKEKGFYSIFRPENNLRILVMNTNACDNMNFYLISQSNDPQHQLLWIQKELQEAEESGQDVFIMGHIPPGDVFCSSAWASRYNILVERYTDIIKGQFFGHTHNDQIEIQKSYKEKKPTNIVYIAPSLTTHEGLQPSIRVFEYFKANNTIKNFYQYRLDLQSNRFDNADSIQFDLIYDFKSEYGFDFLQKQKLLSFSEKLEDQKYFLKYARHFYTNSDFYIDQFKNPSKKYEKYFKCSLEGTFDDSVNCLKLHALQFPDIECFRALQYFSQDWTRIDTNSFTA